LSVYVVVVAGASVVDPFQLGYVNVESHESVGVKVAFAPLVYEAVIATVSPDVIVAVLAVIVHPAAHVTTTHDHKPVQSVLQ
jgi:hypothetical protein